MAIRKINKRSIDANSGGTGSALLPAGTTAERPASATEGQLRYNTSIGFYEQYSSSGWQSIAAPPIVSSVSPSTFDGNSGAEFTINGSNFDSGSIVKFVTSGGTEYTAATITRVSASQLLATTPRDFTVAEEPLSIKVINGTGLSFTLEAAVDCGGLPTWVTSAGALTSGANSYSYSQTVQATDPDGSAITYSVTTGSLPTGLTLNSSTGVISGTITGYTSITTVNFGITATDNAGNTTERSFSILVTTNYFGDGSDGSLST